jgi:hypothetical protein
MTLVFNPHRSHPPACTVRELEFVALLLHWYMRTAPEARCESAARLLAAVTMARALP